MKGNVERIKKNIVAACVLVLPLIATEAAESQTFEDLQIRVRGYELSTNGGEHSSVSLSSGAVVIGSSVAGVFSVRDCGYFTVSGKSAEFEENATTGWRVEITPLRVVNHTVTFRLRWIRAIDTSKALTPTGEDIELTMRPGESRPMDSAPVRPGAKTFDSGPCKTSATSLQVSVDFHPHEEFDHRLIAADLWLVERLQSGGERSQALSLRGLPNRPMPFYFDSIVDGTVSLDFHGHVVARLESPAMKVTLQTITWWGKPSLPSTGPYRMALSTSPSHWLESVLTVKPDEIVEIALPKLTAGPFANRVFAIRLRARQLR